VSSAAPAATPGALVDASIADFLLVMDCPFVFVNYENATQIKDRARRQIISTHIRRFHRNRARPSRKKDRRSRNLPTSQDNANPFSTNSLYDASLVRASTYRRGDRKGLKYAAPQRQHVPRAHEEIEGASVSLLRDPQSSMHPFDGNPELQQQTCESEPDTSTRGANLQLSPRDLLGQGRVDPFVAFAVDEDYSQICLGIDYGKLWRISIPVGRTEHVLRHPMLLADGRTKPHFNICRPLSKRILDLDENVLPVVLQLSDCHYHKFRVDAWAKS
jgi:hypothetical protein